MSTLHNVQWLHAAKQFKATSLTKLRKASDRLTILDIFCYTML